MPSATIPASEQYQGVITVNEKGDFVVGKAVTPVCTDDSILVKVGAVAINPSDTKMLGDFQTPGAILGTDYAGTVVAVGANITANISIGDLVCGAAHGMNGLKPNAGAFAEYVATNGNVWLRLPKGWTVEAAASLSAGLCTAGLALNSLGLPMADAPVEKPLPVMVYGGSTATGTLVMQLLRLANLVPIAVCSAKNFELAKRYGAEKCFDYHSATCAEEIREWTKGNLKYTVDCITTTESATCCYGAIGRAGGRYVSLDPYAEHVIATRKVVKADWVLGPSIFGEAIAWPGPYARPGSQEVTDWATKLYAVLQKLLDSGKLRNHPLRVLPGGLPGVLTGLKLLSSGVVSGEKIVVQIP